MEEWRPIPGYGDSYEVSSLGRVRSLPRLSASGHRLQGRVMSLRKMQKGYVIVNLTHNAQQTTVRVHRLVCTAFHGDPPEDKALVLHGDRDPSNNAASNLRWGSHADNVEDAFNHGTRTRAVHCATCTCNAA